MQNLDRTTSDTGAPFPEVVLQFGGGNFLRAFTDWIIDVYNEKKNAQIGVLVATTTARKGYSDWNQQEGLYHLITKGISNGAVIDDTRLIKSVSRVISMEPDWSDFLETAENPVTRFVISNTTEAGIRFNAEDKFDEGVPSEFPGKLTRWLYRRYQCFGAKPTAGLIFLPVELIDENGTALKECILRYCEHWNLEPDFLAWVSSANHFCNSLVDRIVPGLPKEDLPDVFSSLGYVDRTATQGESYHLWAIEAAEEVRQELPLDTLGLNIVFTENLDPYRLSKVRILNGLHTSMVPVGLLAGLETVGEVVDHPVLGDYIQKVVGEEIIPSLHLPGLDLEAYASEILDRFRNPFVHHRLLSISLNSVSKFQVRVLPSLLAYMEQKGELPQALCLSFAALIHFYRGTTFPLNDQAWATTFMADAWGKCDHSPGAMATLVAEVLGWERAWNQSLAAVPGLQKLLTTYLLLIEEQGMMEAIHSVMKGATQPKVVPAKN